MRALPNIDEKVRERRDEDLLALSLSRPSVFAVLLERYQRPFLRKALAIVRNKEDAEDVVQDTFTKIYLHAHTFAEREGASFRSWAYKILLNTSFTHYQKQKRSRAHRALIDPEMYELLPDVESRDFEKQAFSDYVASVIARMPGDLGRALRLHFLEGRPQAEVAELEGVSVGAIKTRIHRAKKTFRSVSASIS